MCFYTAEVAGYLFDGFVFIIAMLNLIFIHPVPGLVYLLLSLIYFPVTGYFLRKNFGFSIPVVLKLILGIIIILFTFGVSDLGQKIDNL